MTKTQNTIKLKQCYSTSERAIFGLRVCSRVKNKHYITAGELTDRWQIQFVMEPSRGDWVGKPT